MFRKPFKTALPNEPVPPVINKVFPVNKDISHTSFLLYLSFVITFFRKPSKKVFKTLPFQIISSIALIQKLSLTTDYYESIYFLLPLKIKLVIGIFFIMNAPQTVMQATRRKPYSL